MDLEPFDVDTSRVIVVRDVYSADGKLVVENGARGTVHAREGGRYGVLFDQGQALYVKPGFNGRLYHYVDVLDTEYEGVYLWACAQMDSA